MALGTRGVNKTNDQKEFRARRFSSGEKGKVCRHGFTRLDLTASDSAAGVFTWQNPNPFNCNVVRVILYVSNEATGACTVDIGTTSSVASSDNLLDGVDVGTAVAVFDNVDATDQGTSGRSQRLLTQGSYVTGSVASGASAGLEGSVVIEWVEG